MKGTGQAGVKWHILTLGGERSRENASTQTLRLKLAPEFYDEHGKQLTGGDRLVSGGDMFTHGSGNGDSASYNQISLGGDYNLSKRTDLYLVGAYQRATGTGAVASVADYDEFSASNSQAIVSLGIRHNF